MDVHVADGQCMLTTFTVIATTACTEALSRLIATPPQHHKAGSALDRRVVDALPGWEGFSDLY